MEDKSEKSQYDVQVEVQSKDEQDTMVLARLGKKSVLKVGRSYPARESSH